MATASSSSDAKSIFEKYAKFGKTEAQIKEMKGGLRIETRNIQKLMKESMVIDSKYTSQLLDNDISKKKNLFFVLKILLMNLVRVIGKLVNSKPAKYPKGRFV